MHFMEGRHGESLRDHLQPSLIEFGVVVEVAPLGLPMHHKRVQASGGETMKPLLRPLFTAMGSVMITGSIGQPMEPLVICLGQSGVRYGLVRRRDRGGLR